MALTFNLDMNTFVTLLNNRSVVNLIHGLNPSDI